MFKWSWLDIEPFAAKALRRFISEGFRLGQTLWILCAHVPFFCPRGDSGFERSISWIWYSLSLMSFPISMSKMADKLGFEFKFWLSLSLVQVRRTLFSTACIETLYKKWWCIKNQMYETGSVFANLLISAIRYAYTVWLKSFIVEIIWSRTTWNVCSLSRRMDRWLKSYSGESTNWFFSM